MNDSKFMKMLRMPAILILLFASSCSLDIKETDSLITEGESSIFNGVDNVDSYLGGIYGSLYGIMLPQDGIYALTEVTTDEQLVPTRGTDWGDNGVWRTLHAHTWGSTHSQIINVWNGCNSAILRCTEVLDPLTTGATPHQIAEAKFARAWNMWIVMDFFGQVPFRNPSDGPDIIPDVMTRSEAYDMVIQDLTDAIENLPAANAASDNKSRPTKATARFWKAKVLLNKEVYTGSAPNYQDIIDLVDQIENDGFGIESNYFELFVGPDFSNSDVIWTASVGAAWRMWNGLHYNQTTPSNTGGGWNGFTTLAEFYEKFDGPSNDPLAENAFGNGQEERRGYTQTMATTNASNNGFGYGFQVGQMYGWDGSAAVALKDRSNNPLVFTKELPGLVGNNELTGIRVLKYSPMNYDGWWEGIVMSRFADAHLMRAEAMLRNGDAAGALTEVNELRAMRENTDPLTGTLTLDILLDERARELYLEGWRRNDLIRFGKFKDAWQFKEAGDGHTDLFPIPSPALLTNPNLQQNPGY